MLSVMTRRSHQTQSIAETAGADWNRRSVISTETSLSWLEITTFVDEFYDGAGRYLGRTGCVDIIPDGVVIYSPPSAGQPVHSQTCGTSEQRTDTWSKRGLILHFYSIKNPLEAPKARFGAKCFFMAKGHYHAWKPFLCHK